MRDFKDRVHRKPRVDAIEQVWDSTSEYMVFNYLVDGTEAQAPAELGSNVLNQLWDETDPSPTEQYRPVIS